VNNNKPGEFVSSSGNFFDLASIFSAPDAITGQDALTPEAGRGV
jgi:hypothetical protein